MLVIRDAQLAAFEAEAERAFAARVAALCGTLFPELAAQLGPAGVTEWVTHGLDRAKAHGLETGDQRAQYVQLLFLAADRDLDARPWAAQILGFAEPPDDKLRTFERRLRRELGS